MGAAAGLFNDEEPSVRKHAAEVLGLLGQEAAAEHADRLLELCSDSDRDVRMAARAARGKLGLRVDLPPVVGNGDALPDFATIRKGGGKADGKGGSKFGGGKSRSHELGSRQSQSGGRIDRHIAPNPRSRSPRSRSGRNRDKSKKKKRNASRSCLSERRRKKRKSRSRS